jgi:hypothetical protein
MSINNLMISCVESQYTQEYIANVFWNQRIARVRSITLIPYLKNDIVCSIAYITIEQWGDSEASYNFIQRLKDDTKEARIIHRDEEWWLVKPNTHNDGEIMAGEYTVEFDIEYSLEGNERGMCPKEVYSIYNNEPEYEHKDEANYGDIDPLDHPIFMIPVEFDSDEDEVEDEVEVVGDIDPLDTAMIMYPVEFNSADETNCDEIDEELTELNNYNKEDDGFKIRGIDYSDYTVEEAKAKIKSLWEEFDYYYGKQDVYTCNDIEYQINHFETELSIIEALQNIENVTVRKPTPVY